MNELEKKIYEYLKSERGIKFSVMNEKMFIKDITEITEKENTEMEDFYEASIEAVDDLWKENEEIRELNKAQVLENAQIRIENTKLKKQNLKWQKEYNKLEYDSTMEVNRLNKQLTGMAKHIDELEHQAADIKYLNQDEVEDILNNMMDKQVTESGGYFKDGAFIKAIDKLCSLAIKPTTKEKK